MSYRGIIGKVKVNCISTQCTVCSMCYTDYYMFQRIHGRLLTPTSRLGVVDCQQGKIACTDRRIAYLDLIR